MTWKLHCTGLEDKDWEPVVGPDINDPVASAYSIVQGGSGLSLVMASFVPYGGWLAKHVEPLLWPANKVTFKFTMTIDDATLTAAQVAEVDTKITDHNGITYDLSAQINFAKGWMFQIGDPWVDTGIILPVMDAYQPSEFCIHYDIDYDRQTCSVLGLDMDERAFEVPQELWNQPGQNVGWARSEIVTQLQQCNNSQPGGYTLLFSNIGYVLVLPDKETPPRRGRHLAG